VLEQIQTFPFPNCKQIISDSAAMCRFCGVAVDRGIARMLAATQSKVNQACSDASRLKSLALAMWTFLALSLVPFLPLLKLGLLVVAVFVPFVRCGFLVTFVAVIVLFSRWQLRFGYIENTSDPDYAKAKRNRTVALALWLAALLVYVASFALTPWYLEFFRADVDQD
jgi:uncharacterized membrane protein